MNKTELMDSNTIESLRSVLEEGVYELYNEFMADCALAIERMAKAIEENNVAAITDTAHYLKGSAGNIGAIALSNACQALEQQAKDKMIHEAEAHIRQIRQLFDETSHYMKQQMS